MRPISYKRHRFPPDMIRHAAWLSFRFTLSFRDVEELLAQGGIEACREAVPCWMPKSGPQIVAVRDPGPQRVRRPGGMRENNRAENALLAIRRREQKQQKFKSRGSAQWFLASHAPIYNAFNPQTHLISRTGLRTLRARAHEARAAATAAA